MLFEVSKNQYLIGWTLKCNLGGMSEQSNTNPSTCWTKNDKRLDFMLDYIHTQTQSNLMLTPFNEIIKGIDDNWK